MFNALFVFILLTSASALIIPRAASHPTGWLPGVLEDYTVYHMRYIALGCQFKHGDPFFDMCCHPLLVNETLPTARGPECVPPESALSSVSVAESTPTDDGSGSSRDSTDSSCPTPANPPPSASDASATPPPSISSEPETSATPPHTSDRDPSPSPAPSHPHTSHPEPSPSPTHSHPHTSDPDPSPRPTHSHPHTSDPDPSPSPTHSHPHTSHSDHSPTPSAIHGEILKGFGTYFYQNGVAGACGTVHKDSDLVAAIDSRRYGNTGVRSSLCGKEVKITNEANGKTVTVVIADACPTCNDHNSFDLSVAAFERLASLGVGLLHITAEIL